MSISKVVIYRRTAPMIKAGKKYARAKVVESKNIKLLNLIASVYDLMLGLVVIYVMSMIIEVSALAQHANVFPMFGPW